MAQYLDLLHVLWTHPPNGGARHRAEGGKLKAQGAKKGVPDVLIFTPPPLGNYVGAAIELKRTKGGKVSEEQRKWLEGLAECGWFTAVAKGFDEAKRTLDSLGYRRQGAK